MLNNSFQKLDLIIDAGPQIADDPTVIETEDADKDFKIADIQSAGYVLVGEGKQRS